MSEHEKSPHNAPGDSCPQPLPTASTRPDVSWGAIIAGLFAVLGTSWLLFLLGEAIGVSFADVTNSTWAGKGLAGGVIFWLALSTAVAYFVGSALTARLAAVVDNKQGMINGFVLWSVATTAMLLLAFCGVRVLLETGAALVGATTESAASVAESSLDAAAVAAGVLPALVDTELGEEVSEQLLQRLSKEVALLDPEGGVNVSAADVRSALANLDAESLDSVVDHLADEDQESAAALISEATGLTADQAEELVDGAYEELEERFGDGDGEGLAEDVRRQLREQSAKLVASLDPQGDVEVEEGVVSNAIQQLDGEEQFRIAALLVEGRTSEAKDRVVSKTDLSDAQVNELLRGVKASYEGRIAAAMASIDSTVETASTYYQQLLWAVFACSALGLAVSVLGGWCGADSFRRSQPVQDNGNGATE